MPEKAKGAISAESRWAIQLDWFPVNHRSSVDFFRSYLCAECAASLSAIRPAGDKALLETIHGCCAQKHGFINERMPVLESVFRLFLKNGNHPLTLPELSTELNRALSGDIYRTSAEILARLLKDDRYYGLRRIDD